MSTRNTTRPEELKEAKAEEGETGYDGNQGYVSNQGGTPVQKASGSALKMEDLAIIRSGDVQGSLLDVHETSDFSDSALKMEDGTVFQRGDRNGMYHFIFDGKAESGDLRAIARSVGMEGGVADVKLAVALLKHLTPVPGMDGKGAAEGVSVPSGSLWVVGLLSL